MNDLISRQEVLNKLNELDQQDLYLPRHFKDFIVDQVPSFQRKNGQWVKYPDCMAVLSVQSVACCH